MTTSCYINDGDKEKPLIVIFTQQDIEPWGELSFSYSGVSDEDIEASDIPVHALQLILSHS
jgi:histone-lysine N-methyltransferase SUV39H